LKSAHDSKFFIEEKHVRIRGIYKDVVGSAAEFFNSEFGPNVAVAMTVRQSFLTWSTQ
jgi:hypothetical protein